MDLKEDDVLAFDFPIAAGGSHHQRQTQVSGRIVSTGNKRGFQIEEAVKR